ncbi:Rnase Y domain-containing protein [[Mycoplasma] testudinis]|uniref:Rnase Y domain-containing protein n=1 Tax=[Mycoplasma] testudinis TaxID=33924 RepID=UPI0006984FF3|nr:Rnase Y domain-containing protein [[Mycoplasma] testudinis]
MFEWLYDNPTNPYIFAIFIVLGVLLIVLILTLIILRTKKRNKKNKNVNKKQSVKEKVKNDNLQYQDNINNQPKNKNTIPVPVYHFQNQVSKNIRSEEVTTGLVSENYLDELNELKASLRKEIEKTKRQQLELAYVQKQYEHQKYELETTLELENLKLSKVANMSVDQAKTYLMKNVYQNMRVNLNRFYKDEKTRVLDNLKTEAQAILINAMEGMAEDIVAQRSVTTVALADEALKGRLIGKQGRNKRLFETLTGVDMIIEKQSEVSLSCVNPIRREIAVNLLNSLIRSKNIEPAKIESLFQTEKENFEISVTTYGREALEDKLLIYDFSPEIYPIVGRLRFRYSYGQNVLQHCLECAHLASSIAMQIGADPEKAKRAAFFHDIGKSVDFEEDYDHVESGVQIAKRFNLPEYIVNAIESHHHKIEPSSIYGAIVKVVDTISAARPGARIDSFSDYIKRVQRLEEICKKINGVSEAYALQSGRIVRIVVKPDLIKDEQLELLMYEIQRAIEADELVNKHQIRVVMIREKRIEDFANQRAKNSFSVESPANHYDEFVNNES